MTPTPVPNIIGPPHTPIRHPPQTKQRHTALKLTQPGVPITVNTGEPCLLSLLRKVLGWLSLFFSQDRVPSLGRAVEQFLAAKPLSPNAHRSYAYCLGAVVSDLGAGTALADVTPERLRGVLEQRWGNAAAATWNNRLAAVGSFRRWAQAQGWITEMIRWRGSNADRRYATTPRRSATNSCTPCGPGRMFTFGRRHCGGCCTKPRPAPTRYWPSTSRTSTSELGGLWSGAKEATAKKSCGLREPPASYPDILGGRQRGPAVSSLTADPTRRRRSPRPVSRHRPGSAVVSAGLGTVPQRFGMDAAPAAPLRPHPSRREGSRGPAVES